MARKAKDNPTNLSETDVADELRAASSQLVNAQEALEAAREPVRGAKAIVKASGIDFDIFKLCHGIRHLDDDDARQKRIRKLQVAIAALLSDRVQLDLFGFMVAQVKPAVKEALREASDTLQREEPEVAAEPQDAGLPFDPPSVPVVDEPVEDAPALMAAADMPENAGGIANNGLKAGRLGHGPDANPHPEGSVEARLWEQGRARGAEMGPEEGQDEGDSAPSPEAPAAASVVEFTGTTEQKRLQAYFHGYDALADTPVETLTKGRRGEIKARIEAGHKDRADGIAPRYPRPEPDEAVAAVVAADPEVEEAADADPARVGVRDIDGKSVLFDLLANSPLVDVSSPRTGEAWAIQINEFFADRLDSVPRAELIDAAKTLARGRMLVAAQAPGQSPAYDLRSAV